MKHHLLLQMMSDSLWCRTPSPLWGEGWGEGIQNRFTTTPK
jgi:hypothetical protein